MDRKTYWGFFETVRWICTRDDKAVAAMWDMSEEDGMARVLFSAKTEFDPRILLMFAGAGSEAEGQSVAPPANTRSSCGDSPNMMEAGQAIDELLRKIHARRVQMTAIRCDGGRHEQIPAPSAEEIAAVFVCGCGGGLAGANHKNRRGCYSDAAIFAKDNDTRGAAHETRSPAAVHGRGAQRLPCGL